MRGSPRDKRLQLWIDVRRRFHLSDAHVQMARELGLNPKKLGSLANHKQEPWKLPLPEFIEHLYERRFGRRRPERVVSIEDAPPSSRARTRLAASSGVPPVKSPAAKPRTDARLPPIENGTCRRELRPARVRMNVLGEVAHIVGRARLGEARIVTVGPLVFFSTPTGDAWLLDPADASAMLLARSGEALPLPIVETDETFTIDWGANYSIEPHVFRVVEHTGKVIEIVGYPLDELRRAIRRV